MSGYLGAGPEHWEKLHDRKPPDELTWYQARPEMSLRMVEHSGIDMSDRIVDVGGGSSRLCDELLQRGFIDVTVLDISSGALARVGARFADNETKPTLVEADVGAFRANQPFGLWHDRAVFHFLVEPDNRRRYLESLRANLWAGGFAVMATFGLQGPETCSGLPVHRYGPDELAGVVGDWLKPCLFEEEFHATPAGGSQHFLYGLFEYSG